MKFVPKSVSRFGGRTLLKLNASSPTILVVAGVVGLGATAVLAAKATRNIDPVLDTHKQTRAEIGHFNLDKRDEQKQLIALYSHTSLELAKVYGPTLVVGTLSTASVLYGHKILRGRHMASIAAYTGLMDQFTSYRSRVAKTLGETMEQNIYNGATGQYEEDPDHKGEYKLKPNFDPQAIADIYLRPWFDEKCPNWTPDPYSNYAFLRGVQAHMNQLLQIRGYVFLNDVYDAIRLPRTNEGQVAGWIWNDGGDNNLVDFGFMSQNDPQTVAFRNGVERNVRLNFNIDGNIFGLI